MEFVNTNTDTASLDHVSGYQSLSVLTTTSNVDVIDNKTMDFIKRYQVYAYRTAEAFIKLAVTYAEAKRELDCVQFQTFANWPAPMRWSGVKLNASLARLPCPR
jgi:hypothetical protein